MIERRIVVGLIQSKRFISQIQEHYDRKWFDNNELRLVAKWCFQYYGENDKAPRENLVFYLNRWSDRRQNPDKVELMEDLIESLLNEPKVTNITYLVKEAIDYFELRKVENLARDIEQSVAQKDVAQAITSIEMYRSLPTNAANDYFFFDRKDKIVDAFEQNLKPLFTLPGRVGDYLNRHLIRAGFVAFLGREKVGKSWILTHMAMMALRKRLNVAYFEMGDSSESQWTRRMMVYLTKSNYMRDAIGEQLCPIMDCKLNQTNACTLKKRSCRVGIFEDDDGAMSFDEAQRIGYKPCTACKEDRNSKYKPTTWYEKVDVPEIDWKIAQGKLDFWKEKILRGNRLMVSSNPSGTVGYLDVRNKLNYWKNRYGFVPDVVIADYMDIMKMNGNDKREANNELWLNMRGISIDYNLLFITATQADAASYNKFLLDSTNFSEDKRKLAHPTAVFGLNKTPKDEERKVMRINSIVLREGGPNSKQFATVLQDLNRGRAFYDSY
jgi:hypothetical protein